MGTEYSDCGWLGEREMLYALVYLRDYLLISTSMLALIDASLSAANTPRHTRHEAEHDPCNKCFMKESSYRIIEVYKTLVYMLLALEIAIIIRFNSRITKPSPENVYQLELFKHDHVRYQEICDEANKERFCAMLAGTKIGWFEGPEKVFVKVAENAVAVKKES